MWNGQFPEYIDSTVPLNSVCERKYHVLSKQSNATNHKYTDIVQLL